MKIKKIFICVIIVSIILSQIISAQTDKEKLNKRKEYLEQLLLFLPPEQPERGRVTVLDSTWQGWLKRTGELPPDFDSMPSIPFLPDPLILDEGGKNIPITNTSQWNEKRKWMENEIKKWITGTFPPKPDNMEAKIIDEKTDGNITSRIVELRFGPELKAKMTVELLIPSLKEKFPVFMTQWNHRGWAMIAVRRGYIGCIYAAADGKDDTEDYAKIWYPQYDFTRLMRRAWGAHRVVDYLYTLPFVDKEKIGITGHSRNGKQSLMAAAFDERIKAVVLSSGGTGSEDPWRYTNEKFDNESIYDITTAFPYWFHPRLRFFIGREHKLPVDQNHLMSLVAPRGLLICSAITESQGNPWGIEQVYISMKNVYKFFKAEDKLGITLRHGEHGTATRDIEVYFDFFDYVFGRKKIVPKNNLYYNYSFLKWVELSGENIDPLKYPLKKAENLLVDTKGNKITEIQTIEQKKNEIINNIKWGIGEEPSGVINNIKRTFSARGGEDYLANVIINRVKETEKMGVMKISPYNDFSDYLYGYLFFPKGSDGRPQSSSLPVVIFLHEYAYATGFARRIQPFFESLTGQGFAVFAFDMIGFGTRIEEGTLFYERYPHWSKMGKMVTDIRSAVNTLANIDFIDSNRIYTCGYSLGGTVGLYAAALDKRIKGTVSICGFTPMRQSGQNKDIEGIKAYSHLHGLLPRLGFFIGNEYRIPYDFNEILLCIAPRKLLIISPQLDRDADNESIKFCVEQIKNVYEIYGKKENFMFLNPFDYSNFFENRQKEVIDWIKKISRME